MNPISTRTLTPLVCAMLLAGFCARADNWPRFRGTNGSGIAPATEMPNQWTARDWLWNITLPGKGHSSPAIWDGRVFVTSADESAGKRFLLCLDASTGKTLWQRDFPLKPYRHHPENSAATATPAVDESGLYVAWLDPEKYLLMAFDHEGKDLWSVDLGPYKSQHMNGSSPIVVGDNVVLAVDQEVAGASFVIAVDRQTGRTKWKTPRRSDNAASSTPCVYESPGQPPQIILTNRTEGIMSLDAQTGGRLWSLPETLPFRLGVASPVAGEGIVLGNCGEGASNRTLSAVRPPSRPGDKPVLAWQIKTLTAPYVPTPLIVRPRVFLLTDTGQISCVELASGKVLVQQKIAGVGPGFYGSLVRLGDRLVCVTRKGEVIVLSADKLEVLGRTPLEEATFSTPAVAGGRVYFRTLSKLACIGK